jgi:hypothetical protein
MPNLQSSDKKEKVNRNFTGKSDEIILYKKSKMQYPHYQSILIHKID